MVSTMLKMQYAIFGAILMFIIWMLTRGLSYMLRWVVYIVAGAIVGALIFQLKKRT